MLMLAFADSCVAAQTVNSRAPFEAPAALEADVAFWVRIYSELSSREGVVHDAETLQVYEQVSDLPPELSDERRDVVKALVEHHRDRLERLAAADHKALLGAAERVRFQSGQADRFRQGLERAGAWREQIERMLAEAGLPAELAALPHVESSYDPWAYSKSGAAGLWQLMRATGRRHNLRVDERVDERFDPLASTNAAIAYLREAHDRLGSWPLAVIAYNHGVNGMLRAKTQLGSADVVRVLRDYRAPSFKFASRSFYPSFLAALQVERNALQLFGEIAPTPQWQTCTAALSRDVSAGEVAAAFGRPIDLLQALNPALRPAVWSGAAAVPAGYALRVPEEVAENHITFDWLSAAAWRTEHVVPEPIYIVRPGDSVWRISSSHGMPVSDLLALNDIARPDVIHVGQRLRLRAEECMGACRCIRAVA
ncbi:MAG TPA: transglycosylase SLT domain-containing protein [Steroidobacteraceae bacterium]|nr:transglycosylase SLT domain-containing protein [Steroidobacteraceae bacterium]